MTKNQYFIFKSIQEGALQSQARAEIELRGNCSVRSLGDSKLEMGHWKQEMGHWKQEMGHWT